MPKQIPSRFERYEFTEEELKIATTFHPLQLMYFKDLRGKAAETKLGLRYDPKDSLQFMQDDACVTANIALLDEIIGEN